MDEIECRMGFVVKFIKASNNPPVSYQHNKLGCLLHDSDTKPLLKPLISLPLLGCPSPSTHLHTHRTPFCSMTSEHAPSASYDLSYATKVNLWDFLTWFLMDWRLRVTSTPQTLHA